MSINPRRKGWKMPEGEECAENVRAIRYIDPFRGKEFLRSSIDDAKTSLHF